MKIMKFGGTSVGSADRIKKVGKLISGKEEKIVVLSAMSGTTNSLEEVCKYMRLGNSAGAEETINTLRAKYRDTISSLYKSPEYTEKASNIIAEILDSTQAKSREPYTEKIHKEILAVGEMMSTTLMELHLREEGVDVVLLPALDFMKTDENGEPDNRSIQENLDKLLKEYDGNKLFLTQGFICRNANGETDNLQRGGSDYTASLIGACTKADVIEIWTDIDGMHNNDPRFVENTHPVGELHFDEAAELAYFGAKILHPTCILPAKLNNVPVRLLNTMQPDAPGTLIHNAPVLKGIRAVAAKDNITAIKIKSGRMLLAYGFLSKVFAIFEKWRTPIDMIVTSEVGVSLTVDSDRNIDSILEDLKRFGTVTVDKDMVIVCVVGDMQWQNCGFEAAVVNALKNIPIRMISYGGSNYNISLLIRACDKQRTLKLLNENIF